MSKLYRRSSAEGWGVFVGSIIGVVIGMFITSWFAMLCVGAAHASDNRIPALGFVPMLWIGIALSVLVGSSAKAAK